MWHPPSPVPPAVSGASVSVASVEWATSPPLPPSLLTPLLHDLSTCCRICCKIDLLMILDDINGRAPVASSPRKVLLPMANGKCGKWENCKMRVHV